MEHFCDRDLSFLLSNLTQKPPNLFFIYPSNLIVIINTINQVLGCSVPLVTLVEIDENLTDHN